MAESDQPTSERRQEMESPASRTGGYRGTASAQMSANLIAEMGTTGYKEYDLPPYAQVVRTQVSRPAWSGVFFSWLSLKGHLQGLREFDRTQCFATMTGDGRVEATFVVVWQGPESLTEWLQNGYDVETMLRDLGVPHEDIAVNLVRDFS